MRRMKSLLFVALLPAVVAGCGARYFEYQAATEIPEGPGMFSGQDGAFVLYSNERKQRTLKDAPADPAQSEPASPDNCREFREFQAFKHWKEANRDTAEYREFREWQEWKAFRARKERVR